MKKVIYIIIVSFLVTSVLAGCGRDDYAVEKLYWKTQKQAEKIYKNPHASPPKQLERVVNELNKFIERYPDNRLAVDAEFSIANLYIVKEEYVKGRAQLEKIIKKHTKFRGIIAQALFLIGNSYEIQDKWVLALSQYNKIMQDYPLTMKGLEIPVYIAQHYKIKYQPDKMVTAYQSAIGHYKALANKYPGSPLALNTESLAARCYIEIKDWQGAINTYENMLTNYKGKVNLDSILFTMAGIYSLELKDNAKAKMLLEQLIKDYPKSNLKKTASSLLKEIDSK